MKEKASWRQLEINHIYKILSVVLIFFVTVVVLIWWHVGQRIEEDLVERQKGHDLLLARAGARAVGNLLEEVEIHLLLLAKNPDLIKGREKEGRAAMSLLADHLGEWEGLRAGVSRVDKEGKIVWGANTEGSLKQIGMDVSDRDYFTWAQEQGEAEKVFFSGPMAARGGINEGKMVIMMASPLLDEGIFNGLVMVNFSVEELGEKYVLPLALSGDSKVSLLSEGGEIVSSSETELLGKNLKECVGEETAANLCKIILEKKEESLLYNCRLALGKEMMGTLAPIKKEGEAWSLMVSFPYEKLLGERFSLRVLEFFALLTVFSGLVLLILVFVLGLRISERQGFTKGFKDGRNGIGGGKKV